MHSAGLRSIWLSLVVISSVALLPACDGDGTGTGGAGGSTGGAGGSTGGAGGSTGGTGGTGGSTGGTGGTGGAAFSCDDYCTAIDAINGSLGCNPFDCSMTCPDALANFAAAGCSAEGEAAFSCIMKEPEASWECDAADGELIYNGAECSAEVQALIDCQSM